ncbi:DUF7860 family protein [Natronorubrum halophilum]|uniref:DUF7860 family protein n=1 Tax=Natronorubrum halophilum TaxID=1702106 RepID=UPI000EF6F486|nr:hypothetical protein [Natronorubrum halophilum]
MGRYGNLDYPLLIKAGFLTGLSLFTLGAGGELLGSMLFETLPAWEHTLFLYSEALGLVVAFFTPWIFGVLLPLTE